MARAKRAILVVDDAEGNRAILCRMLAQANFVAEGAADGGEALERLVRSPTAYCAVLLDRMMPGMGGMDVLRQIKTYPELRAIPVIFQTAMVSEDDILAGLRAGAFYYLTKPVCRETLLAVTRSAVSHYRRYLHLQANVETLTGTLALVREARFTCRTLAESMDLADLLAHLCPQPDVAVIGLSELLVNAVEHGNLGISYAEKTRMNEERRFKAEVRRRLALPENAGKTVEVLFERSERMVRFVIRDQGPGFDWSSYVNVDPLRVLDTHGRGIAMAKLVSFSRLEYRGSGNEVVAEIDTLQEPEGTSECLAISDTAR